MSYVLSEPYATLYEEYLECEKRGLSIQAYDSLKGQTMRFLKWLEEKELPLQEVKIVHLFQNAVGVFFAGEFIQCEGTLQHFLFFN